MWIRTVRKLVSRNMFESEAYLYQSLPVSYVCITFTKVGLEAAVLFPLMSFFATLFFKHAGNQFIAVWLQTTFMNFPVAFFWQLIYAGPIVRFIFRHIFPEKEDSKETAPNM